MSEINVINVSEINAETLNDPIRQKALLAMQATKQFVEGDEKRFIDTNCRLLMIAGYGIPPSMTYEDVVITNNDPEAILVMSNSDSIADAEARFYLAHAAIEKTLDKAIQELVAHADIHNTFPVLDEDEPPTIAALKEAKDERYGLKYTDSELIDPSESIAVVAAHTKDLRANIKKEDFAKFRPYFVGINGFEGPSGLYSCAVPIIDLLTHGGVNMGPEERTQIYKNLSHGLYPRRSGVYASSNLLHGLLNIVNVGLDLPEGVRRDVMSELDRFRAAHRGAVKRYIPGAIKGETAGTGGVTTVAEYLDSKIFRKKDAK